MTRESLSETVRPILLWGESEEPADDLSATGMFSGSSTGPWTAFVGESLEKVYLWPGIQDRIYQTIGQETDLASAPAGAVVSIGLAQYVQPKDQRLDSLAFSRRRSQLFPVIRANSTGFPNPPENILETMEGLFRSAREEVFEDGMESEFSERLIYYIRRYRNAAITAITRLIISESANAEVASEALRWIGHIYHPASYGKRRWLLERSLSLSSARVRDGALLGLSFLDDPHAIPYLAQAARREKIEELRLDMIQVLAQLENTQNAAASQEHTKG